MRAHAAIPAATRSRSSLHEQLPERGQVVGIQRSRLLRAAVGAVDELGYTHTTVAHITRRARVSRRTFYELFANREECILALVEEILEAIRDEIITGQLAGLAWRERVRTGLLTILAFFDREPALARVCVVQAVQGGAPMLELRERVLAELVAVVDEGRSAGARGKQCTPLAAEGLVGAALTIVYTRLLRDATEPLSGLLGELMALIVLPYLGPAAARHEQSRPVAAESVRRVAVGGEDAAAASSLGQADPFERLTMRMTYRTARVLEGIGERPGASNRQLAERAGISDQGQISKLLGRLERLGLVENTGPGHSKGEANAWSLTDRGERVAHSIRLHRLSEKTAA